MSAQHFDVIVIGAGSGSKLARPAAKLGFKVAYIEKGKLGGTCLNHGCIPSKMLLHTADVVSEIEEAGKFNIKLEPHTNIKVDKEDLVRRVCNDIDSDSASILPILQNQEGITLFQTSCRFIGPKRLLVGDDTEITGDRIFISVGCRAYIPPEIEGLVGTPFLTYKEALRLERAPKSLLVIGAGYIATELGYFFSKTGSKVEFLVRSGMLSAEDPEIVGKFTEAFCQTQKVTLKAVPKRVSYNSDTGIFTVHVAVNGIIEERQAESLFVATGVTSKAELLELTKTGVALNKDGFIVVDEYLQTNVEGIYAFGDCIGRNLFKHSANYEGEYLFKTLFQSKSVPVPLAYPPMPHAVFTNPQIAGVGLTEPQALAKYSEIIVGTCDYTDVAMGNAIMDDVGFCKLIFSKSDRILVGAHIIGKEASTLIHMCIAYMKFKATVEDMDDTIYIHPALPEVIRGAVRDAKSQFSPLSN